MSKRPAEIYRDQRCVIEYARQHWIAFDFSVVLKPGIVKAIHFLILLSGLVEGPIFCPLIR